MQVKIQETGKIETLSITDPKTGIDWTEDLVGNYGAFSDGQFQRNTPDQEYYTCHQETYDWWKRHIEDRQIVDDRIYALNLTNSELEVIRKNTGDVELEDITRAMTPILDKIENERN